MKILKVLKLRDAPNIWVLEANTGAAELTPVKLDKAD